MLGKKKLGLILIPFIILTFLIFYKSQPIQGKKLEKKKEKILAPPTSIGSSLDINSNKSPPAQLHKVDKILDNKFTYESDNPVEGLMESDDNLFDFKGDCEDRAMIAIRSLIQNGVDKVYKVKQKGHVCYGVRYNNTLYLANCNSDKKILSLEKV